MVEVSDFFQPALLTLTKYLLIFAVAYFLAFFSFPHILGLITKTGMIKPNFREEPTPAAGGLIFVALLPLVTGISMLFSVNLSSDSVLFLFVILGMGFLGLVDDLMGNTKTKGFKGHIAALIKSKELTSGGFKAIFGATIALVFSIGAAQTARPGWIPWTIFIDFILVALAANMINLFDLRPGRAGKIYLFGFLIVLAASKNFENYIGLFLPIVAIMVYYLPLDLKAKVMLGDVGANLLGASLGMLMAWTFSDLAKVVAAVIMIGLQVVAEKYSFTRIIERFHILKYLDEMGGRKY